MPGRRCIRGVRVRDGSLGGRGFDGPFGIGLPVRDRHVQLAPDQAFNPAVKILLERGDIEITDLKEHDNRCRAVAGDRKLTFRVVEYGDGPVPAVDAGRWR